jgi:hypothetical protein
VKISLLLVSAFFVYVFYISPWYWQCQAHIDPSTLSTSCAEIHNGSSPKNDAGGKTCDKVWPSFGICNSTYDDLSSFWGDDFLSQTFENSFALLGKWTGPIVMEKVIPKWNDGMKPEMTRKLIFDAVAFIFTGIAGLVLKDFYDLVKRRANA